MLLQSPLDGCHFFGGCLEYKIDRLEIGIMLVRFTVKSLPPINYGFPVLVPYAFQVLFILNDIGGVDEQAGDVFYEYRHWL